MRISYQHTHTHTHTHILTPHPYACAGAGVLAAGVNGALFPVLTYCLTNMITAFFMCMELTEVKPQFFPLSEYRDKLGTYYVTKEE